MLKHFVTIGGVPISLVAKFDGELAPYFKTCGIQKQSVAVRCTVETPQRHTIGVETY